MTTDLDLCHKQIQDLVKGALNDFRRFCPCSGAESYDPDEQVPTEPATEPWKLLHLKCQVCILSSPDTFSSKFFYLPLCGNITKYTKGSGPFCKCRGLNYYFVLICRYSSLFKPQIWALLCAPEAIALSGCKLSVSVSQ